MRTRRTISALGVALALVIGTGAPVFAQLSGSNADASGSSCTGSNTTDGSCLFSRATQTNTGAQFKSRYAWNINADISAGSTKDISGSSTHHVNVGATATGGYRLDIATSRTGDLNRNSDIVNCEGSADTSGVTGSSNIALSSGTLTLGDPGALTNGTSTTSTNISQTASATIFRISNSVLQTHNLTFTWNGSVRSNSCEAAVRQGESSGTTSGCSACGYPGSPSRTNTNDGHFVTVTFTSLCGNGTIDGSVSEQCDLGSANGSFGTCCTNRCRFTAAATACRDAAGECDLAETCNGTSATCPADAKKTNGTACTSDGNQCTLDRCDGSNDACQHPAGNGGTTCRAAAGFCDLAETCTGTSTACPTDAFKGIVLCRAAVDECDQLENCPPPGFGVNCPADIKKPSGVACTSDGNPCTLDQCNGTSNACQHPAGNNGTVCRAGTGVCDPAESCNGSSTVCPSNTILASTSVCRSAAGNCDIAETCTGTSGACPADAVASATTVCRAQSGGCDLAELCSGSSVDCPSDSAAGAFVECRGPAGGCDVAEVCDGVSHACPADALRSSTFTCRASAGSCDVAETCNGTSAACPSDAVASSTVQCRGSAGSCDVAENCTGTSAACPTNVFVVAGTSCRASGGVCDVAETCTGTSGTCPANAFVSATTQCRAGSGACDAGENCTGTSATCPANAFASSTVQCRAASGACDMAESCSGSSAACPADSVAGTTFVCRGASGVCDVAETCDGLSHSCPANAAAPSTTECRASVGVCDVAETCTGSSTVCPVDLFAPNTQECRASADSCDAAESCTGLSATCPADLAEANGTPCDDGSTCTTSDSCQDGTCSGSPTLNTCLDEFLCYKSRVTSGTAKFAQVASVHLVDAFEDRDFRVIKPKNLCTPADKHDGNGTVDADTHLVSYKIRAINGTNFRASNLLVTNDVGSIRIDTIRPDLLFVPAGKDLLSDPADPPFNSHAVDHYKCYKVRVTRGTAKFTTTPVTISDQFISPQKVLNLRKIRHLCTPVDKNAELRKNPTTNLLCYQVKPATGEPKFPKRIGLFTHDQFGALRLDATKEREFCVPSTVTP